MIRHGLIGVHADLRQKRQCVLAGVSRTTVYAKKKPVAFNSDQGSQFTSDVFTNVLKREGIAISMDGRGRAYDNIFVERLCFLQRRAPAPVLGKSNAAGGS